MFIYYKIISCCLFHSLTLFSISVPNHYSSSLCCEQTVSSSCHTEDALFPPQLIPVFLHLEFSHFHSNLDSNPTVNTNSSRDLTGSIPVQIMSAHFGFRLRKDFFFILGPPVYMIYLQNVLSLSIFLCESLVESRDLYSPCKSKLRCISVMCDYIYLSLSRSIDL